MSDVNEPASKRVKLEETCDVQDDVDFTEDTIEEDKFMCDDKYNNFVTPEELQKLREFKVLDEVKSNEEDSDDAESVSSDGKSQGVPEDELEKMLDEDLPHEFKVPHVPKEKTYIRRTKIVLEEKGVNHFEILPLDWMMVRHYSGMPIYMHRGTRVCTLSKPYFLGNGNTRRHDIPISAIPCLAYRRALEEEKKQDQIDRKIEKQIRNSTCSQREKDSNDLNSTAQDPSKELNDDLEINDKENQSEVVSNLDKDPCCNDMDTNNEDDFQRSLKTSTKCPINNENQYKISSSSSDGKQLKNKISACPFAHSNSPEHDVPELTSTDDNDGQVTLEDNESQPPENNEESKSENVGDGGEVPLNEQPVVLPGGAVMAPPRVESVKTSWKTQQLRPEQLHDYCRRLFVFKSVNIMHFKRWADRRKYIKARKTLQCPTLPEGTKLITIPAQNNGSQENGGRANKRDWVMNMNGRSYLSVFHEYVRRALQQQPQYKFKQLENAATPYEATVYIGDMQYGVGHGSSKRQAKSAAARASIHILIPEMREHLDSAAEPDADFSFFDYVGIEDPRIPEFCAAACEPSPHAILRTCLLRNFGAGDPHIHTEMKKLEHQKIELTMKVGKHSATVVCKNKKSAKQRAAQTILQALHPHVQSWGSLLRLYGSRSVKSSKERKQEEQQITLLQDQARRNEPNRAVLDKLRHDMRKLRARDAALAPVGTLLLQPPPAPAPPLAVQL